MNSLKTTNYAERTIYNVLGFIWVPWAIYSVFWGDWITAVAVLGVFALGLIDDLFGTSESKGFRGHLRALKKGRITTGLLKLVGISVIALVYAIYANPLLPLNTWVMKSDYTLQSFIFFSQQWSNMAESGSTPILVALIISLLWGASIALTSNFFNLLDLRPGRASKVYLIYAAVPVTHILIYNLINGDIGWFLIGLPLMLLIYPHTAWPILLTIIPDLREKAMLGDGGANAAGFLAGTFIVFALPLWALVIYLLIMLFLNFASEKVSYSKVIESSPLLTFIDNIGRLKR
jgi:hypothetical protein